MYNVEFKMSVIVGNGNCVVDTHQFFLYIYLVEKRKDQIENEK